MILQPGCLGVARLYKPKGFLSVTIVFKDEEIPLSSNLASILRVICMQFDTIMSVSSSNV